MSDFMGKVNGFFSSMKKAAGEAVEGSEIALARGKTAAKAVYADSGELIVDAGHKIDDAVIEQAKRAGKLAALLGAAVTSQAQDIRDKTRAAYGATPDGAEAHSMATSEQYLEARQYIGRASSTDVTALDGTLIIGAGSNILDEHVRAAREADQLGSLIYSAQQSPAVRPQPIAVASADALPTEPASVSKRAARPLTSYYDEEEAEVK